MISLRTAAVLMLALIPSLHSIESGAQSLNSSYQFDSTDTSCGGFPRLAVTTFSGSCLGLVTDVGMKFPRKILELQPSRFLVTDMGGWDPVNHGVLWELDLRGGQKKLIARARGLLVPHDIQFGPDGNVYVGERGRVTRFKKSDLLAEGTVQGQMVVGDVLSDFTGMRDLHPLMKFAFGKTSSDLGDLYVNVGALTDSCVKDAPKPCSVGEKSALIRKFKYNATTANWDSNGIVWARGLRNSMGLVFHSSGTLLQSENARDFANTAEPFDELNWIQPNKHYGWPYCYDFKAASPEWRNVNCAKDYSAPYLLIPPHAAPLDMLYYDGAMFPELQGQLLMSWHGYRATGARVVAYPTNEQGLPVLSGSSAWSYTETTSHGLTSKRAAPEGGGLRAAPYVELISVWNQRAGLRPAGAPVGLTVSSDGSILIVDDKNHSVLILTRSDQEPYQDDNTVLPADHAQLDDGAAKLIATPELKAAFSKLNASVFQPVCATCHDGVKGSDKAALEFLTASKWVLPGNSNSPMLLRVLGANGLQRMPLGGSLAPAQQKAIQDWILRARPRS